MSLPDPRNCYGTNANVNGCLYTASGEFKCGVGATADGASVILNGGGGAGAGGYAACGAGCTMCSKSKPVVSKEGFQGAKKPKRY